MNVIQDIINTFQELVAQVPEFIQPLVVMLAGAIPSIEGDVAAVIGIVSGLNPIVAGIAGATGNFLTVFLIVLVTSRARKAVVSRNRARVGATVGAAGSSGSSGFGSDEIAAEFEAMASAKPESKSRQKGRQRFTKWLVRFGVPGASILGPLALPSQVTSAILVAGGSPRAWVLLWHAVSIVLWTTISAVSAWLALTVVFWL